ncbi:MAG: hypothetical protein PQJ60_11415 [Spirochaetales bacterium]|nr:hypothetical protein [Spirochaetales bacterium]
MAEETGEPIEGHALLRVISSEPEDWQGKWLLFFKSSTTLYYKRFPHNSPMTRLLNTGQGQEKDYPVVGERWERIRCVRKRREGFLSRILGAPSYLELKWGEESSFRLEADKAGEALFAGKWEKE